MAKVKRMVRATSHRGPLQGASAEAPVEVTGAELDAVHSLLLELDEDCHFLGDCGPGEGDVVAEESEDASHGEVPAPRARGPRASHGTEEIPDLWMLKSSKTPLLTAAREITLAKRVEQGDRAAAEELVNANVRLVAAVARRYVGRGLPLEDLIQEGLIGLMRAVEKYNYRKGYRFSTYATHWIRQAISRALANQGRSIRLPAHVVDTLSRVSRVREDLFHRLGRPPTRAELAEAAGISEKKLMQLFRSAAQPLSLETPVGPEGSGRLGDFLPAGEESSPSDRAFRYMVREELEHALNTLTPREKEVIILRYGLGGDEPQTLEETGRRLRITRERARQIEVKAMEKLRRPHTAKRLLEAVA
ncbi:MAG: sigma-70 family RNA polymerase sigma factor [Chthonomonadales bacterium]